MKILQAFDFLSLPHGGGTVDIVYKLSKALTQRGHEVTICTGDHDMDWEYLSGLGNVGLKMYHSYFNRHGIYLMPGLARLDVRDYDVMHLHCYRSVQNIMLYLKAQAHDIPYVIDAHGSTVPRTSDKRWLLTAYDLAYGQATIEWAKFLVAETAVGIDEWVKLGAKQNKIRMLHPLLDTSEFVGLPRIDKANPFTVLFLGRIHNTKGLDTLMEAFQKLVQVKDARLVIAGQDDGYLETLTMLVNTVRLQDKVSLLGFVGSREKLAILSRAGVLVQPSRNEAGARPSLEAIMCHTPVIVSKDTGAGREIASFGGGLLFDTGNAGDLAAKITQVMDNPGEARVKTEKARDWIVENLSLENGITGYEKLYQEATR